MTEQQYREGDRVRAVRRLHCGVVTVEAEVGGQVAFLSHLTDDDTGMFVSWDTGSSFRVDRDEIRIERPVPTEHCLSTAHHDGHEWGGHVGQAATGYWCPGYNAPEPSMPTREQIAEVMPGRVELHRIICGQLGGPSTHDHQACENAANAVHDALLQKGGERG